MRYWWVNHKQTHVQEIAGGYLWSPIVERDGKFSQYYQNMRLVRTGDLVISYAAGEVRAIGRAVGEAIGSPRPEEFGQLGKNWADTGWLVPISWTATSPFRPKSRLPEIGPLLPEKYSPIQAATGNGNQKAYLTQISEALFSLVQEGSGSRMSR